MSKYRKTIDQVLLFGIVGVGSLLIDVIVTTFLYNLLHIPAAIAGVVGFVAAFLFNFPLNRKKVFKHENDSRYSLKLQIILYLALCIFNLFVTALLMHILVDKLGILIFIAKALTTALISVYNFFVLRFFIFSQEK